MQVKSRIFDKRISSENFLIETSLGDYVGLIEDALYKNPFQRKKVTSSKTVYSLLREDIKKGCVIPPIVLALSLDGDVGADTASVSDADIVNAIRNKRDSLLILDGLQRTHSFLDLLAEKHTPEELDNIRSLKIRIEVYVGLNKIGILYRMLTLNTGQTPMSLRQQIEMLYLDYYDKGVDGIKFIREVDSEHATLTNEYNFKEIIEGFNSYLERNEQPLERSDLLENIRSLEKLSHENSSSDLFHDYVTALHKVIEKIVSLCEGVVLDKDDLNAGTTVWGRDALRCLKKAQVFSGFGAAAGKLKDFELIGDMQQVIASCDDLKLEGEIKEFLVELNNALDWLSKNTKKIGNAQRLFFHFYFRELFNPGGDSFQRLKGSIEGALHKTKIQLF